MATQADIARALGISRSAVSKLAKNSERTGAPLPDTTGSYEVAAWERWYTEEFKPTGGPTRGIRAKEVDTGGDLG